MTSRKTTTSKKTTPVGSVDEIMTPPVATDPIQPEAPKKRRGRTPGSSSSSHTEDSGNEELIQPPAVTSSTTSTSAFIFSSDMDGAVIHPPPSPQTPMDSQTPSLGVSITDPLALNQANLTSLMMDANANDDNKKKEEVNLHASKEHVKNESTTKKGSGIRKIEMDVDISKKTSNENIDGKSNINKKIDETQKKVKDKRGISEVEGSNKNKKQNKKTKNRTYVYHGTVVNKEEGRPRVIILVSSNILKAYVTAVKECRKRWGTKAVDRNGVDLSLAHSVLSVQFVSNSNNNVYFGDKETVKYLSGDTNNNHYFYTFVTPSSSSISDKKNVKKNNSGCYVVSAPDSGGALKLLKKYCRQFDDLNNPSTMSEMSTNMKEIDENTNEVAYLGV